MPQANNYLDILKILPKTNCRDCGMPTCMTFAVGVLQGKKTLADCPHLAGEVVESCRVQSIGENRLDQDQQGIVEELERQVAQTDFDSATSRLGARLVDGKLAVPMLGKDFLVDRKGQVASTCHTNMWLRMPLLNYIIRCSGKEPSGRWVPLRDLPGGPDWGRFFEHRCVQTLKKVIDGCTDLFETMIDVFQAEPARAFDSDVAVVLYPLPKVPMLICYWKPEEGMDSDLSLFWDADAEENLNIDSLCYLGTGMTNMFEKIARTHGK